MFFLAWNSGAPASGGPGLAHIPAAPLLRHRCDDRLLLRRRSAADRGIGVPASALKLCRAACVRRNHSLSQHKRADCPANDATARQRYAVYSLARAGPVNWHRELQNATDGIRPTTARKSKEHTYLSTTTSGRRMFATQFAHFTARR